MMKSIGVDLGGHKIVVGLVESGRITSKVEESTEASREPAPVIAQVARMVHQLGGGPLIPTGICVPGSLDAGRECIMMMPNFRGWNSLPVRRLFENAIDGVVAIENDANAYALGEGVAGAAVGMTDYIVLTLGTGIGGGVMTGGKLLTGAHGMGAELGHIVLGHDEPCGSGCRGFGHFEAICGADALEHRATAMGLATSDLKELWLRREEHSVAPLWNFAIDTFARGIASLVNIFDPETVILGGGLRKGEGFLVRLQAAMPRYLCAPYKDMLELVSSWLDTDAPIFGVASLARDLQAIRTGKSL